MANYCTTQIAMPVYLVFNFRCDFLSDNEIQLLDDSRDSFLGPPEDMTSNKPGPDPNNPGHLIGGTKFERLGQHSVKDGR